MAENTRLEHMVDWRLFKSPTARYDANGSTIQIMKLHIEMAVVVA